MESYDQPPIKGIEHIKEEELNIFHKQKVINSKMNYSRLVLLIRTNF